MMEVYDQLHSIPNGPPQQESYRTNDTRGVAFTQYNYIENPWKRDGLTRDFGLEISSINEAESHLTTPTSGNYFGASW